VLFKLFIAKKYPTNQTLNTRNKILMKNDKTYFLEKKNYVIKNCQNLNSKYFELVSRVKKLKILTRKTTDKNTTWK
jgi:hypothetical protein